MTSSATAWMGFFRVKMRGAVRDVPVGFPLSPIRSSATSTIAILAIQTHATDAVYVPYKMTAICANVTMGLQAPSVQMVRVLRFKETFWVCGSCFYYNGRGFFSFLLVLFYVLFYF